MVSPSRHAQLQETSPQPPQQQPPRQPKPPGGHSPVAKRRAPPAQKEAEQETTLPAPPPQHFKVSLAQARSVYGRRGLPGNEPLFGRRPDRLAALFPPRVASRACGSFGYPEGDQSLVAAAPEGPISPGGASSRARLSPPLSSRQAEEEAEEAEEEENSRRAVVDRQDLTPSPGVASVSEEMYACSFVEDLVLHVVETETVEVSKEASRVVADAEAGAPASSVPRPLLAPVAMQKEQRSDKRLVAPAELPPVVKRTGGARDPGVAPRPMPTLDDLLVCQAPHAFSSPLPSARSGKHVRVESLRLPRAPLTAR